MNSTNLWSISFIGKYICGISLILFNSCQYFLSALSFIVAGLIVLDFIFLYNGSVSGILAIFFFTSKKPNCKNSSHDIFSYLAQ
jgi:hypothetical protein